MKWKKQGLVFGDHWSQLPVVDSHYTDSSLRVYYSQRIGNKSYPNFIDIDKNNLNKVINQSDKPIIPLGELGRFDQAGVMPAEIITVSGIKYLYYIGWSNRTDVPYFNTIGLAISEDGGENYRKFSTGPVFGCSHKEPGYTGTISIMIENGIWRAWYLSCQKWEKINNIIEPFYDIKYAESTNGIDWEPTGKVCIPLGKDMGGISQASVFKKDGKYHMMFSHRKKTDYRINPENSYRIGHATSNDGISWEVKDYKCLNIGTEKGETVMVEYPYVIKLNNSHYMFYNGDGFGKTGIFYAKENTPMLWK